MHKVIETDDNVEDAREAESSRDRLKIKLCVAIFFLKKQFTAKMRVPIVSYFTITSTFCRNEAILKKINFVGSI